MMDGFNLDSPLVCEGIIGDGCGGGRIFFAKESKLFVYDPTTQERNFLVKLSVIIKKISKNACVITLATDQKVYKYELSQMKIIDS